MLDTHDSPPFVCVDCALFVLVKSETAEDTIRAGASMQGEASGPWPRKSPFVIDETVTLEPSVVNLPIMPFNESIMSLIVLPLGLLESRMEKTELLEETMEEKSESAASGGPRPLKDPSAHSLTGLLEFKIPPVRPGY